MRYIGDFNTSSIIRGLFNTRTAAGVPITLGGTPSLSVYKSNSTTESTAGVTLTVDFDSRTGLHFFAIDTSADGTFYAAGEDYRIVVTAGTVDSVSVVGHVVAVFSLANRSALRPTTAGRTLDVSAGGEAGIDLANVGSPTTTLNLSGTTIKTATDVETDTADIQSRLPAALVSGRMDSSVGAMAANVLTASAIASDAITDAKVASDVTIASVTGSVGSVVGLTPGNLDVAVSTRASQTSVDDLPTSAELATALGSSDDATLSAIAALNNLSAAQVNAEVLDVLNVDTFAELSAPPAATSSLRAKLTWLFMWARNRSTQTSTERKLYADDATTVVGTEAVSDDGTTYSKGEAT